MVSNLLKNKYILISIACAIGVIFLFVFSQTGELRKYYPNLEESNKMSANGAAEYLNRIKANQESGIIELKDVRIAQKQYANMLKLKSGSEAWTFRGPDNIGGRTRALLIDKDNSAIMYAGGVSGGLWKSESYGQFWEQVKYEALSAENSTNLSVNCITQSASGDIYIGTGEGHGRNYYGAQNSAFIGDGIWKSTDGGKTFIQLQSTVVTESNNDFYLVYEIAAHPSLSNVVYAGTAGGLKISEDGGVTWTNVEVDQGSNYLGGYDVAINANGDVVASIGNKCYVKKAEESVFMLRSGKDEGYGGSLITEFGVTRLEFAFAPSDENYIYCVASSLSYGLKNIYQSTDRGDSWSIVGKGNTYFNPLGNQGDYDLAIAVHPTNKNLVFVGGLDLWEGKAVVSGKLFEWNKISEAYFVPTYDTSYVHADLHAIVFDPHNPNKFYIGSDGGISRANINYNGEPYWYSEMNKGYGVTQYYSVGVNSKGYLLGGTQDNGSLLINGEGNTQMNAIAVAGGDGGHVAMSKIVPTAAFVTQYYGGLYRNIDADFQVWNQFYSDDIITVHWQDEGGYLGSYSPSNEGAFVTPIAYWETDNDIYGTDTVSFIARRDYLVGEKVVFNSANLYGAPILKTIQPSNNLSYPDSVGYKVGDTIRYYDPYGSLLALGMARTVWITRKATTFTTPSNEDWYRAVPVGVFKGSTYSSNSSGMETTTELVFSHDGNHLFIATDDGNLFRLSNIVNARSKNSGCTMEDPEDVVTTVTKIANFGTRAITGLGIDPNNSDRLVVTLGNYGNDNYVYYSDKATTAITNSGTLNFFDITNNLPKAPAYSAIIEANDAFGKVYVGTELGVFMADNVFSQASNTVSWSSFNEGLDPVAVFQMEQINSKWSEECNGVIYVGTHGRGVFENRTHNTSVVGVEENDKSEEEYYNKLQISANVYPNPFVSNINVSYILPSDENVLAYIYTINGQLVRKIDLGRAKAHEKQAVQLYLNYLKEGAYMMYIAAGEFVASKRIIKY